MIIIVCIILLVIVYFWVKKKTFSQKEEKRINEHNKLRELEKDINEEYQDKTK